MNVISAFQQHSHFCVSHWITVYSCHIFISLAALSVLTDELWLTHEANCFKPSPQDYFNIFSVSVVSYRFLLFVCSPFSLSDKNCCRAALFSLCAFEILPFLLHHTDNSTHSSSLPFFLLCVSLTLMGFPQLPFSSGNRHHLSLSVITSPIFFNCLKLNCTISSSCLTSLSPSSSHLLSFPLSVTQQDHYTLCVCVCVCIYLSICLVSPWWQILVLSVSVLYILAAVAVLRLRVPVHRPPGSNVTAPRWPCQITYGAHIWASSIRNRWPEGVTAPPVKQTEFTEAWLLQKCCRIWNDVSVCLFWEKEQLSFGWRTKLYLNMYKWSALDKHLYLLRIA